MTPQEFKQARHDLGLSAQALANELGMSPTSGRTIRRWESGECKVPPLAARVVGAMVAVKKTAAKRNAK